MPKKYGKLGNPAQRAAIRAEAYAMSLKGMTNVAIGTEFGVSREAIRLLLKEYIAELTVPLAEDMRKREDDKLNRLEALAWKLLADKHIAYQHGKVVMLDGSAIEDTEPVFKAIDRVLKVSERRSKLWGIDMPTKSEHTIRTDSVVDDSILALVAEMEAKNQADRMSSE